MLENIKRLLEQKAAARDNDQLLVSYVWYSELLAKGKKDCSAIELLRLHADGVLTNHDTITRARRKLQEQYVELRGNKYKHRKEKQEQIRKNPNKLYE